MKFRRFSGNPRVKLGTIPASQTRAYKPANPFGPQFHLPRSQRISPDGVDVVEAVAVRPPRYNKRLLLQQTKSQLVEIAKTDLDIDLKPSWRKEKMVDEFMRVADERVEAFAS